MQVVAEINHMAEKEGRRPIVFITLVNDEVRNIVTGRVVSYTQQLDVTTELLRALPATASLASSPTSRSRRS